MPSLAKKDLCAYLRDMDIQEYDHIKKEHEDVIKACNPKAPIATGLATAVGTAGFFAATMWPIKGMIDMLIFESGLFGFAGGGAHFSFNVRNAAKIIETNRASRLEDKMLKLSERIESLTNCPKEKHQLQLANGFFSRGLQNHSNKIIVDYR